MRKNTRRAVPLGRGLAGNGIPQGGNSLADGIIPAAYKIDGKSHIFFIKGTSNKTRIHIALQKAYADANGAFQHLLPP